MLYLRGATLSETAPSFTCAALRAQRGLLQGFADSPVATCRLSLRGLGPIVVEFTLKRES